MDTISCYSAITEQFLHQGNWFLSEKLKSTIFAYHFLIPSWTTHWLSGSSEKMFTSMPECQKGTFLWKTFLGSILPKILGAMRKVHISTSFGWKLTGHASDTLRNANSKFYFSRPNLAIILYFSSSSNVWGNFAWWKWHQKFKRTIRQIEPLLALA